MYLNTSKSKGGKATVTRVNKPNAAQRAREGQKISSFVVNAREGFNISGKHKFNLVRRGNKVLAEYCKTCSAARRILRIKGADVDYVKKTLNKHKGWPVDSFNTTQAKKEFSFALIQTYKSFAGKN